VVGQARTQAGHVNPPSGVVHSKLLVPLMCPVPLAGSLAGVTSPGRQHESLKGLEGTVDLHREAMPVSHLLSLFQGDVAHANRWGHSASGCLPVPSLAGPIQSSFQSSFSTHPITPGLMLAQGLMTFWSRQIRFLGTGRQFMPPPQALGPRQMDRCHQPAPGRQWGPSPAPSPHTKGRQRGGAQCLMKQQPVFPTHVFPIFLQRYRKGKGKGGVPTQFPVLATIHQGLSCPHGFRPPEENTAAGDLLTPHNGSIFRIETSDRLGGF
jgi:hypothetical protein